MRALWSTVLNWTYFGCRVRSLDDSCQLKTMLMSSMLFGQFSIGNNIDVMHGLWATVLNKTFCRLHVCSLKDSSQVEIC